MNFEFDAAKSARNLAKHGIDFVEAQRLWEDSDLLVLPAHLILEPRAMVIGVIDDKTWTAIITYRGPNTRIISVRRSRMNEALIYESGRIRQSL